MSGKINLAAFAAEILQRAFDDSMFDGADVQAIAERCGLLARVPFDPVRHHGEGAEFCEPGDEWFEYVPALKKAIAKATPSPSETLGSAP